MRLLLILVSVCFGVLSLCADAKDARKLEQISVLSGCCLLFEAYGKELNPKKCEGKVTNADYNDGRTSFSFMATNGAVVLTFSGNGRSQIHEGSDTAVQPVDVVLARYDGHTDEIKAVGNCRFSNPYKGPVPVLCSADSEEGRFAARFMTDGREPSFMRP